MNSSSFRMGIPIFFAFSTFDPVLLPVTRKDVFFVKEFLLVPPDNSTFFFASFLFNELRVPVKTKIVSLR